MASVQLKLTFFLLFLSVHICFRFYTIHISSIYLYIPYSLTHTCTSITHIFCVDASHSRPVGQLPVTSVGRVAPKQNANVLRLVQANTWFSLHNPQLDASPQLAEAPLLWKQILGKSEQMSPSAQWNIWSVMGTVPMFVTYILFSKKDHLCL